MYFLHEGEISFSLASLCRKGSSWWIEAEAAGGVCCFTFLPDLSQTVAPDTHQLTGAFNLDLVFCKQRPKTCRLLRERVKQRDKTAGNSEGMITDAFRGPPEEVALEETKIWNQYKKREEEPSILEHI